MTNINKRIAAVFAVLILCVCALFTSVMPSLAYAAETETITYSNVLTDLQKDSNFKFGEYPTNNSDYSISVIQVAETTDGKLLIYSYQPCYETKPLPATKINMSLTNRMGENIATLELAALAEMDKPKVYDLTLVSNAGVFCKYVVNDFAVSTNIVRYYNIASIYREAITEDGETGTSNILGQRAYGVGQLWTAVTYNGNVGYSRTDRDLLEIRPDQKYVGKVRYTNGYNPGFYWIKENYCDAWYIAFDCNYTIDELYEADVTYSQRTYHTHYTYWGKSSSTDYGEWQKDILITAECGTTVKNGLNGWWGRQHEWQEIQSVSKFIESEKLTDEAKKRLKDKQWVIRFAVTDYTEEGMLPGESVTWDEYGSEIADVSIIRLLFKSNGKIYNLGVVDSMHTPAPDAPQDNIPDTPDFSNWWKSKGIKTWQIVLGVLLVILLLVLLMPVLPYVVQFIVWLVMLPIKAIGAVIMGIKNSAKASKNKRGKSNGKKKK